MSTSGLTPEAQLRYLLQWFSEFSELQREDFLPILAAAKSGQPDQLAATLAALTCADKPVSLFQCRIKLFNEWFPTWPEEEQDRLIKGVSETDADFGEKLQDLMTNGPKTNGELNRDQVQVNGEDEADEEAQNETEDRLELATPQEGIPVEIAAAS